MGMEENEGQQDALQKEIFDLEAFIHKNGLDEALERWRESADYEDDLKEYESYVQEEADEMEEGAAGEDRDPENGS
ncbi:TPA: hypothetical protein HA295_00180 [Candidatus Woesearchaeota archaeon]|nr:hypothetical protein [Candidatus Woesearchaeota archaeon]HII65176.1 hypothetical protein [Candidatus Woesearchaeota archaeon]